MPGHHDDDGQEPVSRSDRATGSGRIDERTVIDLKTAIMILGFAVAIATSWAEQRFALSAARYELQAEITRVETVNDKRVGAVESKLVQIQATNCAIARSLHVVTAECN